MENSDSKMKSTKTNSIVLKDIDNKKSSKDTSQEVDESLSFNSTLRVTRSSLTKLQPSPSQDQRNDREIASPGCNQSLVFNVDKTQGPEKLKYFLNSSSTSTEENSLYCLAALPISPMAQMKDQNVFVFDRGDNHSYDTARSHEDNLANLTSTFSELSMSMEHQEQSTSITNSPMLFCPLRPPPFFLDPSKPANIYSYATTDENAFRAVVESAGFISLQLRHGIKLDISSNKAIRLKNYYRESNIALSSCATQMALIHPKGRLLQYGSRIEIQAEDQVSAKNAKMYPKGISFTANNCALVYLVDEAGARSTTDQFHDLFAGDIADKLFQESCNKAGQKAVSHSMDQLECSQYWRSEEGLDCWLINGITVKQTRDGMVIVERQNGLEKFVFKTSPSNGKVRLESSFVHVTASLGEESHMFVKSGDHRLHYNGQTNMFIVRNAGNAAGFDETASFMISKETEPEIFSCSFTVDPETITICKTLKPENIIVNETVIPEPIKISRTIQPKDITVTEVQQPEIVIVDKLIEPESITVSETITLDPVLIDLEVNPEPVTVCATVHPDPVTVNLGK